MRASEHGTGNHPHDGPAAPSRLVLAADSTPATEPGPTIDDAEQIREQRRRTEKHRRDAERPPNAWEKFRIIIESLTEGRQVVEIADHKARYALVIMGVLNALVFVAISRWHLIGDLPPSVKPWLVGVLIAYTGLSFAFVLNAIDCLRPRELDKAAAATRPPPAIRGLAERVPAPRGLLVWEAISRHAAADLYREWDRARMDEINAEAIAISHTLSHLIRAKYRALHRLYRGLTALVVIAAVILGLSAYFTFST
jgi:hypothetical protein